MSIIGILTSMLLPALGKSREKARRAACTSNLKQMGISATIYADDNEGDMPASNASEGSNKGGYTVAANATWYGIGILVNEEYLDGQLAYCPSNTFEKHSYGYLDNDKGGFQDLSVNNPSTIWVNYNYRSSFDTPYRPANVNTDSGGDTFMADHFTDAHTELYGHRDGRKVLYLDGSVSWIGSLLDMDLGNKDWTAQEDNFWSLLDR